MKTKNSQTSIRKKKDGWKLFLVALPFFALYFLFCYLPLSGWSYAFYDYKPGIQLKDCNFVGIKHFISMFQNPVIRRQFIQVMKNTIFFSCVSILTSFVPMFFAILLNEVRSKKIKKVVQTCTTIPNFISWILVYSVVFSMLSSSGFVNTILIKVGLIETGANYLAVGASSRIQMVVLSLLKGTGWGAIVYLASMGSIDQGLYDAAAIDGAGRFNKIRYVTIPGMMPTFLTLFLMSIGNFLNVGMEQFLIFSNAFNSEYIQTLDLYVYNQGILSNNISFSTAVGIYKSVIGILLLLVANWISGKVREEKIF